MTNKCNEQIHGRSQTFVRRALVHAPRAHPFDCSLLLRKSQQWTCVPSCLSDASYMCTHQHMSHRACISKSMCVHVCTCVHMCVCVCTCVHACMFMCAGACVCMYTHVHVCLCMYMFDVNAHALFECMHLHMHMEIHGAIPIDRPYRCLSHTCTHNTHCHHPTTAVAAATTTTATTNY